MGFVVYHKGGMKEKDDREYMLRVNRRLSRDGADFAQVPRVREGYDARWLYVWDDEAEAAAVAAELKKETRDSDWGVRPVNEAASCGPLRPLEIGVSKWTDGWAFALETFSRLALQKRYPTSCPHPSVFIGSARPNEFPSSEADLRRLGGMVLAILSGLTPEQLHPFGGFRLIDPVDRAELLPPTPAA